MQRFLAILGHWLHDLAFALWFGGLLAVGGLVAPSAFHTDRQFAGVVVGDSFRKLNSVSFLCAGIMLAATWAEARVRGERARRFLLVRGVLTAAALALGLYLGIRLFPTMIHLRAIDRMADFDRLHVQYEVVSQVQLWLLAAGGLITAYLALPRRARSGDQPASPSGAQDQPAPPGRPKTRTPEPINTGSEAT